METVETILERMRAAYEESAGFPADEAADIGIRLRVLAGEVFSLWNALEWLKREAFPSTASGAQLDAHAMERGISRKEALPARGVLAFSRAEALDTDLAIPAGTVCAAQGGGVSFVTVEDAVLAAGTLSATAAAEAAVGGAGTNAAAGKVTVLVSAPAGVEAVTNPAAFTGGADAEDDEALRRRLLESYAHVSNGTNAESYRQAALRCGGVASAAVKPRANGAGTVAVYLGGQGETAAAAAVQAVKDQLEALREINVDVSVAAATEVEIPVSVYVKPREPHTFEAAKSAVQEAVAAFFRRMAVGEPFYTARLGCELLATGMVDNYSFEDTVTSDEEMEISELAVAGTVTVEELEGITA